MTILNCTPHPIAIFAKDDVGYDEQNRKLILKEDAKPIAIIPPSGQVLSLKLESVEVGNVEGIPIFEQKVIDSDVVPDDADVVIVSALFASNYKGVRKERLYTICNPVYDSSTNPRPVGCLGLQKWYD